MVEDLDTPCVTVDLDAVERNLARAQAYCAANGLDLRPHVKTHKIPELARLQLDRGAVGITCQKLGEAEVMADHGIDDILVTFPIVGAAKLRRLVALARRTSLSLVFDDAAVAVPVAEAVRAAGLAVGALVECDVGAGRCGVQSPAAAAELAARLAALDGLNFRGLMTYAPKGTTAATSAWLAEAVGLCRARGLAVEVVSTGGTPDLYRAREVAPATEHRPGTYIYSDRYMAAHGVGTLEDCALRVLATVVSRPAAGRAILDAGSKTLSSDPMGLEGYGVVVEYPKAALASLSEEHGHLDVSACNARPGIGERVSIIPNHACAVSNLHDRVYGVRDGRVERVFAVAARGKVQ
ncbi:MAG: alanine racemase [Rhodospirillaceae bacterium]|nr:alanine racemase [Rhodospirillaceae bacterium]